MELTDRVAPGETGVPTNLAVAAQPRSAAQARVAMRLALVVVAATAVWGLVASWVSGPWIYADELIYSDLAKSIASGGSPAVRGVTTLGYGLVYPLLVAPAWAAFHDLDRAYAAARLINALIMSLAAVPAYFLARRFVSERSALIVSALTVVVPSMVYVSAVMTEVAFYPAMLAAILAIQRALERPSSRRQVVVLLAIGVASATKILAAGLLPAYLLCAVLVARGEAPNGRSLRSALGAGIRSTRLVLAGGVLVVIAFTVVRGSPLAVFGAYTEAVQHVRLDAVPLAFARHVAALALYTAVLPVTVTAILIAQGLGIRGDRKVRAFAALAGPVLLTTIGGVAVFSVYASGIDYGSTGVPGAVPVYERNVFVIVPLLLIGLAFWLENGMPRPRRLAIVVEGAVLALVVFHPWALLLPVAANPQNLAMFPWVLVPLAPWIVGLIAAVVVLGVVAIGRASAAKGDAGCWKLVAGWLVLLSLLSVVIFHGAAAEAHSDGVGADPAWIDHAVGADAHVTIVWREKPGRFAKPRSRQRLVWASEFFNRSVNEVDALGARLPFGLPDRTVDQRRDGVLVDQHHIPVQAEYVLAACEVPIDAPVIAIDPRTHSALYLTTGTVRVGDTPRCRSGSR